MSCTVLCPSHSLILEGDGDALCGGPAGKGMAQHVGIPMFAWTPFWQSNTRKHYFSKSISGLRCSEKLLPTS